jgi:hypothetical protein
MSSDLIGQADNLSGIRREVDAPETIRTVPRIQLTADATVDPRPSSEEATKQKMLLSG